MGMSPKQYEALRTSKLAEARKHGVSEKQLDSYEGELFDAEREYLLRMNPPGAAARREFWKKAIPIGTIAFGLAWMFLT